ncbi:MAG TPA: ABC transporter permease [Steroidobacteraceae bacterium]|nr:ABC transporter permease [Steroidobacteraceae bacterium]
MFAYYFGLAVRSLRRNIVLTSLMILAIGVGIGASMTTLTIFRTMSGDPIPDRSRQLFAVQIDNYGPITLGSIKAFLTSDSLPTNLTYMDAVALMRAHAAPRQAAMFGTTVAVTPSDPGKLPFQVPARATYADFFSMFEVPFEFGAPWSAADDQAQAPVVVIARKLNEQLFGGADSVGRTVRIGTDEYRVAGVIDDWKPAPRFFDLGGGAVGFADAEQVYLPFSVAVARRLGSNNMSCLKPPGSGKDAILHSECVWTEFWAWLPTPSAVRAYRAFLSGYAASQRDSGRFNWPARVALRNVRQWLSYNRVVSGDVSMLVLVSFAFLAVCLLNAVGLMLAKFMARTTQVSVRRALGADARAIFAQCLVEAGTIGLAGGAVGLALTVLGLGVASGLFGDGAAVLTHLSGADVLIAIALSVSTALIAGVYPTWRAARIQPAWQLKVQ